MRPDAVRAPDKRPLNLRRRRVVVRTDCPNPTCGPATVSHKTIRLLFGRDRMLLYLFMGVLYCLILAVIGLVFLGGRLPSMIGGLALTGSLSMLGIIWIAYFVFVISVPFMPGMRRRQERAITAARALLGENEFAAAWSKGYMMPQDKAIAFALEDLEPPGLVASI